MVESTEPRRHLNSSQRAIADAKHQHLLNVYQPVKEDAGRRECSGKGPDDSGGRGRKKNLVEQIPQGSDKESRKTRSVRVKSAGTNPKYIDLADKLHRH